MAIRFKARAHNRYGKRHTPGEMTRVEQKYADELEARRILGVITAWGFEKVKFKLTDGCFYTPDFYVLHNDGSMEFIDVKGSGPIDDKSIVKVKVAAQELFMFAFFMDQQVAKKHGGGWKRRGF